MPAVKNENQMEFRPPSKKAIIVVISLVVLFFVLSSLKSFATFYTDYLLFDSLKQNSTFSKLLSSKVFIPTIAFAAMALLVAITIAIAAKSGKKNSLANDFDEWIIPFARTFKKRSVLIRNVAAILIGFFFSGTTVGFYKEWILFQNSQNVGIKDPQFKKDIGFYLFQLPFIRLVLSWLFLCFAILLIVSFAANYVSGEIRFEKIKRHISVKAKVHLSIICALCGLIRAVQYYFDRFALVHSTRGAVDGATYTDVNAVLPATRLLIFVAIIASILFIVNVYRKGVVLPLVAIALWVIVSLIVGNIYPLVVQNFVVKPSRNTKERPYTVRNIEATKQAYNLNNVENFNVDFKQNLDQATGELAKKTLANTLLWNKDNLAPWVQQQRGEQIYEFRNVDLDRYKIDNQVIPAYISARELVDSDSLPDKSWQSKHVTYSHGFGAAITNGVAVAKGNEPDYLVSDLPSKQEKSVQDKALELNNAKARVYFGEEMQDFVFVGSTRAEQTPTNDKVSTNELGGVKLNNIFKKAAFALRFSDYNIMIADTVTSKSKIVYVRDPKERVKTVAPFLDIDSDPYPVVSNGEINWVVDAYTTSSQYPYSQYINGDMLDGTSFSGQNINYIRNSVKAVVNARTGKVSLYIIDKTDPLIKAYRKAFPKLFIDGSKAPKDIVEHYKYPQELFDIQTKMYGDYHVSDPTVLLKGSNRWQIAPISTDPTTVDSNQSNSGQILPTTTAPKGGRADKSKSSGVPLEPLYQYIQHSKMNTPEFLLTRAFVPIRSSFKMDSFISASSDGKNYGKLRLIKFNSDNKTPTLSPTQAIGQINSDKEYSQEATLLDQRGSTIVPGNLQIIPVGNTVIYIEPIYVKGQSSDSRPVLTYVTVSVSGQTVCAPTIDQAIDALVSGTSICVPFTQQLVPDAGKTPTEPTNDVSKLTQDVLIEKLAKASEAYEKAKNPLDLGALQKAADEMVTIVNELNSRK
ncbi:MAG: UPF0182 family protein [Acidimicrobiia bacterium]